MAKPARISAISLLSSRLFWKFFAAILAAQLAATLAVGAAIWWKNQLSTSNPSLLEIGPHARENLEAAVATLEYAGEPALLNLLTALRSRQIVVVKLESDTTQPKQEIRDLRGALIKPEVFQEASQLAASHSGQAAARVVVWAGQRYLLFSQRQTDNSARTWRELDHALPRWAEHNGPNPAPPKKPHDTELGNPDGRFVRPPPINEASAHSAKPPAPAAGKFERAPPPGPLAPWVMIAAAILVSLAFAAFLAWLFTQPLRALQTAFSRVAQSDLRPQFAEANYLIDDELHQLGRSFDQMTARLRSVLEQQTRLMHDVSHELRSPLARIQAALGLIQQQPERAPTYVERLERETARMDHLIGEILTLARLEAGAAQAPQEKMAISEVIANLWDDMQFEAHQNAQSLMLHINGDFQVQAELELLVRALENLVRNAIKYSPVGSVIELRADYDATDQRGLIRVLDQGPGVADDEIERIFLAFYRSRQHAAQASGHGLGLAITRQIVQRLGGQVYAQNRQDLEQVRGLCLSIVLPAGPPVAGEAVANLSPPDR